MSQPIDGIKVVDAEPQTATNAPQGSAMNANALINNTLDGFANLSSRFNPFAQKLNKGLGQVRQVMKDNQLKYLCLNPFYKVCTRKTRHR